MADNKVNFELVSPERLLMETEVDMVVVPGSEGDFGVLPGHTPMISTIRPGVVNIYDGGTDAGSVTERIFVAGGFAEVTGERLTVLAEEAVPVGDIDKAVAEERIREARAEIDAAENDLDRETGERHLQAAETMLASAE